LIEKRIGDVKMIVVKSVMNKFPKSCNKCTYYASEGRPYENPDRVCYGSGKGILLNNTTKVTVERAIDCPLIEIEQSN
jgi:hypothetical protein